MEGDFNAILDGSIEVKEYRKMMDTVDRNLLDFATRKREDLACLFGSSFTYFFLVDETLDNLLAFFPKTDKPILSREDFREYLFRFLKEEDMGKLSLENFYGITKYISEEELLEQFGYKLENCFSLFYKCGIKNLYELSIQYDSFLDDDLSYLNLGKSFQIMNNIMIKAPITNAVKSIANTDYIETFEKLQSKEKLESKEEVYAYLDSLLKVSFIEEEKMYVYSSSFYKAFPRNFLVENELDFMEDGFPFFYTFYKSGNFFSFFLMAYEDKDFYNILKEKDIIIPQESFGFYYKYLGKEKVFPLLVEYANSLKHISAYTMEKLLEEHYREGIDPNELLNKALYDCLKGSILWGRRISGLPKSFQDTYPQLFLKSTFPYSENIKKLFYEKRISADLLKKYPYLKEELLHVDLSAMLMNYSLPFSNCDDKNIYEILGEKFSNSEILDLMIAFGDTFDVAATLTETDYNLQGTKEEMLHTFYSVCREVIFKYHVSLWHTAPSDFIRENEDLFLDDAVPSAMCTEFYRKNISFMDLKKYNEDGTIVYLLDKAPVFFEHEFIREFVVEVFKRKVSSDKLYTLLGNYNYYIDDSNTIAQLEARLNSIPTSCSEEEILYQLEECIVDKLYNDFVFENFDYDLDAIDFGLFKKRHPDVILDKEINPDFRDICYCKQLTFRTLLSYPTIDIKDKNYAAFFENDISPLVKELDTEELFDLALRKGKAEVIDQMLNFNKAEAVVAWYKKHYFLPDVSVMLNLDINDSEKLLTNARKWSYLMKISNHKDVLEYKEALFKASMIFGVFDKEWYYLF